MVFNPSSIDRLTHVYLGAFLAGSFLVMSIMAYYILKGRHLEMAKKGFKIALVVATVSALSQLLSGHSSAEVVAEHQPAKLAAMEGHFEAEAPADLYILGWVDKESKETTGLAVPGALGLLLHGDPDANVIGLDAFPENERPSQVNAVFQFYHIMVAIGMALIGLTLFASFMWWKGRLFETKWLLKVFVLAVFLPQIANQVGWFTAEMGRQPWVVYGLLRTSDALSAAVTANQVWFSLVLFTIIYLLLFGLFVYLLHRKIKHGPYKAEELTKNGTHQQTVA